MSVNLKSICLASFFLANSNTSLGLTCISLGFLLTDELLDAAARKPFGASHTRPLSILKTSPRFLQIEKIDRRDAVFQSGDRQGAVVRLKPHKPFALPLRQILAVDDEFGIRAGSQLIQVHALP